MLIFCSKKEKLSDFVGFSWNVVNFKSFDSIMIEYSIIHVNHPIFASASFQKIRHLKMDLFNDKIMRRNDAIKSF